MHTPKHLFNINFAQALIFWNGGPALCTSSFGTLLHLDPKGKTDGTAEIYAPLYLNIHGITVQYSYNRQRTNVGFKLAVGGGTGAGGLVAPLPRTAYFGKFALSFGCSLSQQV